MDSVFPIDVFMPGKNPVGKKFIQGFTQDVSAGGLCLIVNNPNKALLSLINKDDETFDININILASRNPIEANVKIMWYELEDKGRHKQVRLGLSYEKISPNDKRKIINAARRKTWFPKIGAFFIFMLICGLAVNNYYANKLEVQNKALINRFHNIGRKPSNI